MKKRAKGEGRVVVTIKLFYQDVQVWKDRGSGIVASASALLEACKPLDLTLQDALFASDAQGGLLLTVFAERITARLAAPGMTEWEKGQLSRILPLADQALQLAVAALNHFKDAEPPLDTMVGKITEVKLDDEGDEPFDFPASLTLTCPCGTTSECKAFIYRRSETHECLCEGCGATFEVVISTQIAFVVNACRLHSSSVVPGVGPRILTVPRSP